MKRSAPPDDPVVIRLSFRRLSLFVQVQSLQFFRSRFLYVHSYRLQRVLQSKFSGLPFSIKFEWVTPRGFMTSKVFTSPTNFFPPSFLYSWFSKFNLCWRHVFTLHIFSHVLSIRKITAQVSSRYRRLVRPPPSKLMLSSSSSHL